MMYRKDEAGCKTLREDYLGIKDDLAFLKDFQRQYCFEAVDGPGNLSIKNIK